MLAQRHAQRQGCEPRDRFAHVGILFVGSGSRQTLARGRPVGGAVADSRRAGVRGGRRDGLVRRITRACERGRRIVVTIVARRRVRVSVVVPRDRRAVDERELDLATPVTRRRKPRATREQRDKARGGRAWSSRSVLRTRATMISGQSAT
jgi:hypothetical protein